MRRSSRTARERGRIVRKKAAQAGGRKEANAMAKSVAIFILGAAVGIAVHRMVMAYVLFRTPDDRCAYCEWLNKLTPKRWRRWR